MRQDHPDLRRYVIRCMICKTRIGYDDTPDDCIDTCDDCESQNRRWL